MNIIYLKFVGEVHVRNNSIVAGIPPGSVPLQPPGLCPIPGPEQINIPPGGHPQYMHVSFPPVQPMQPWTGQMMMGHNQFMYQPSENSVIYSPSGSQQSSPSHSQAHSRSSSPSGHSQQRKNSSNNNNASSNGPQQHQPRTSAQVTQPTSNILTTSTSTSSTQTTSSTALVNVILIYLDFYFRE